jgi:flagellar biosynthesis protein FlhF
MNLKRFTARTSRDALAMVKATFGDEAIVMSTKPCAEGVEVLAMAPESLHRLERMGASAQKVVAPATSGAFANPAPAKPAQRSLLQSNARTAPAQRPIDRSMERQEPQFNDAVEDDVEQLQMSTLSFQDYVRDRMLKRRDAERQAARANDIAQAQAMAPVEAARARHAAHEQAQRVVQQQAQRVAQQQAEQRAAELAQQRAMEQAQPQPRGRQLPASNPSLVPHNLPVLREELHFNEPSMKRAALVQAPADAMPAVAAHGEQIEMMSELRSMRGLIEQRFGALAFMEKLQRHPHQAQLAQRLMDAGYSPALTRKLLQSLPDDADELTWAGNVLERNLATGEREAPLEDAGGVYALIGATGVGKTTSTAKLAAAFATHHGAANLGLITLDAYRVGAHEQLRAYGRILGVPVHTAHDRASLEDLLDLLSGKRMVLIDTAGMAQRDSRTRELLEMLSHRAINRVLVVNASAQGETIEDQLAAYEAHNCRGLVLSKLDEAVKLGPALDSIIRHKLKVLAVANGQRVPEDWHRLSANALVQRSLKSQANTAWRMDDKDVNLVFSAMPVAQASRSATAAVGKPTQRAAAHV